MNNKNNIFDIFKKINWYKILKQMTNKNTHRILVLTITIIVFSYGLYKWDIELTLGNDNYKYYNEEIVLHTGGLVNVTWVLLTSPDAWNWKAWERYARQSDSFFYGRLYLLTKKEAKVMLHDFAENGIDTKLIMENKQYQDYTNSWQHLMDEFSWDMKSDNFAIKSDEHLALNFNHTKTFVNDNYSIIQSANITQSSFEKNTEHFFITENEEIRKNLVDLFKMDRQGITYGNADIHPNILVCPINCREKISQLIESAHSSVYIMHQYLKDESLTEILDKKIKDWLDVRMIFSDTDSNYVLVNRRGDDVVSIQKKPYVHTKIIIIDNKYMIIWSMNLSDNALDMNREIGIIVMDPELIKEVRSQF